MEKLDIQAIFIRHPKLKRTVAAVLAGTMVFSLVAANGYFGRKDAPEQIDKIRISDIEEMVQKDMVESRLPTGTTYYPVVQPSTITKVEDIDTAIPQVEEFSQYMNASDQALADGDYEQAQAQLDLCAKLELSPDQQMIIDVQQGNIAFGLDDYEKALTFFQAPLQREQDLFPLADVYFSTARCKLLLEDYTGAVEDCQLGLAQGGEERSDLYVLRGTGALYLGDFSQAKSDFETAIALGYQDPGILQEQIALCQQVIDGTVVLDGQQSQGQEMTFQSAPVNQALAYYAAGQYAQAIPAFQKLLDVENGGFTKPQLYATIAKCHLYLAQFEQAVEASSLGLDYNSREDEATLRTLLATGYMAQGEYGLAVEQFQMAIDRGYSAPQELYGQMGACYYYSGQYQQAIDLTLKATELLGKDTEAIVWLALSYYQLEDFEQAVIWLERSLQVEQTFCDRAELQRCLSRCYLLLGDYEQVKEVATQAIDSTHYTNPSTPDTYALRGAAYLSQGEYQLALDDFYMSIAMGYADPYELYRQCVLCNFLLADYENTISAGERAIDSGTPTADIYHWMGISYFSLGQYTQALEMLTKVETMNSEQSNLYFYIGVCHFSKEEYQLAVDSFTKSIDREETVEKCTYNRALCYLQLEQYPEALDDLEASAEQTKEPQVAKDAAMLMDSLAEVLDQ